MAVPERAFLITLAGILLAVAPAELAVLLSGGLQIGIIWVAVLTLTALADRSTLVELKINPDGARLREAWYQRLRDVAGEPLPNLGSFAANRAALDDAYAKGAAPRLSRPAVRYGVLYAVLPVDVQAPGIELYRNDGFRLIELPPAPSGPTAPPL